MYKSVDDFLRAGDHLLRYEWSMGCAEVFGHAHTAAGSCLHFFFLHAAAHHVRGPRSKGPYSGFVVIEAIGSSSSQPWEPSTDRAWVRVYLDEIEEAGVESYTSESLVTFLRLIAKKVQDEARDARGLKPLGTELTESLATESPKS